MNTITIIGTVSRDAEAKSTPNGTTYATFSVEVPRNQGQGKTFFRAKAWGKLSATAAALYQGQRVAVAGEMQNNRYQRDNAWVDSWEVNVSAVEVLGDGAEAERDAVAAGRGVDVGIPF